MLQAISNADSALFHGSVFEIDWSIVGGLDFGTFDSSQHTLCVHLPFGGESGGPGGLGVKKNRDRRASVVPKRMHGIGSDGPRSGKGLRKAPYKTIICEAFAGHQEAPGEGQEAPGTPK